MRVNYNSQGKCPFFKTNVQNATLELELVWVVSFLELLKKVHLKFMFLSIIPFTQVYLGTNMGPMAAQWDIMVAERTFRWASRLNEQFHWWHSTDWIRRKVWLRTVTDLVTNSPKQASSGRRSVEVKGRKRASRLRQVGTWAASSAVNRIYTITTRQTIASNRISTLAWARSSWTQLHP